MILKLKLKNIDDNYAWHFIDGVENVAVEKSEFGNIKGITYKKKDSPDVASLVLYKEERGFLAAEAYILNNEGKTIENLNSQYPSKYLKISKSCNKEIVAQSRAVDKETVRELARVSKEKGIPIVCQGFMVKDLQKQYPNAQFISVETFKQPGRRFGDVILYEIECMLDDFMPNGAKVKSFTYTIEQ